MSQYVPGVAPSSDPLSARIVNLLRDLADERGETQATLGLKSSLSQSQISRLYSGHAQLKVDEMESLCVALEVSILDVLRDALSR